MTVSRTTAKQKEIQRITESMCRAICQHRLPPGTRLVEAQIVDSLRANRNHVQSALQRLALQKIVTIEANRGAHVSEPSVAEARDILAARRAVELGLAESITPQTLEQHQDRIRAQLQADSEAASLGDQQAQLRATHRFHQLLGSLSGNTVLADILDILMVRSALVVARFRRDELAVCQTADHPDILRALEHGEQAQACLLIRRHLDHLEDQLRLDHNDHGGVNLKEALTGL